MFTSSVRDLPERRGSVFLLHYNSLPSGAMVLQRQWCFCKYIQLMLSLATSMPRR